MRFVPSKPRSAAPSASAIAAEPTLIAAIAREIARSSGGDAAGYVPHARRLLSLAFRALEQPLRKRKSA